MFALLKKPVRLKPRTLTTVKRSLDVAGRVLPLTIKENRRATRITLRIEPGGRALNLTIPVGLRQSDVDDFLLRHEGWLQSKLGKFSAENPIRPGGAIHVRGILHQIEHTGRLREPTKVTSRDGVLVLQVGGLEDHIGRRIAAFLKREARFELEARARIHAATIRKPITSISMKDTRSRWGSCSWDGNLSFSWRIIMAPDVVIDYLAAHEVAHLQEMNHGPQFWALCKRLCPRTEEARRWLKQHGSQLHAVDFS